MPGVYDAHPYGSITYGVGAAPTETFALSVDWARSGAFTSRNEMQYLDGFVVRRGRRSYIKKNGDGFEQEDVGELSATISDPDGDYNPFNTSSPLYGDLGPNRRMELSVRLLDGTTKYLMTGSISDIIPTRGIINKVRLEGVDGWETLKGQKASITIALQESVYCDDIIPLILTAADWPAAWGHDLDTGQDIRLYWWIDRQSAAQAIFDIAHSELGKVFIKGDGAMAFRNRFSVTAPVAEITDEDYIRDSFDMKVPWETQRNIVTVIARPRVKQTLQAIWSLPSPVLLTAGQTYEFWPEYTYGNETVPAKNVVSPVATTDYLVNTLEDGTGTNKTADLTVVKTDLGNKCKLSIVLGGGVDAYLRTLQVRGEPISNDNPVPLQAKTTVTNQDNLEFTLDLPWIQNVMAADSFDDYMLSILSQEKYYLKMTLKPNPSLQYDIDLGDTIRFNSALLGINSYFGVSYLEHKHTRKLGYTLTTIVLEPLPDIPSYWAFGSAEFGSTTMFAP